MSDDRRPGGSSAPPGAVRPGAGARRLRCGLRGRPARPPLPRCGRQGPVGADPARPPGRPRRRVQHRRRRRHHDPGPGRVLPVGPRLRAAAGRAATPPVWCFLPNDEKAAARAIKIFEKYALVEGGEVLGWRDVPVRAGRARRDRRRGPPADPAGVPRRAPAHRLAGTARPASRSAASSWTGSRSVIRKQAERETVAARHRGVLPVAVRRAPSRTRACSRPTSCRRSSRT